MNNSIPCKAKTESGEPCRIKAGPSGFCHVHDPEKKLERQKAERLIGEKENIWRENREKQLKQVRQTISALESEVALRRQVQSQRQRLSSVVEGLYTEIDKLTKKAPAEAVTDLALNQINDVIRDVKQLIRDDPYIQKLMEFVPAGDNPELRDALLVLGQVGQGLKRSSTNTSVVDDLLKLAKVINDILGASLQKGVDTLPSNFVRTDLPPEWINESAYPTSFNFQYLDSIDIPEHFRL